MNNTEQMVSVPFQREDRYIVIKVSDLAIVPPAVGKPFAEQLIAIQRRLPKRECLVIESDWPEYEPTWAAIEARVAGKPAQHQGEPVAYQFQARDGTWRGFQSQNHYINTVEDGTWPIRPLYTHPAPVQQGKPVAFYREFVDGREYCEKPFTNDWTPLYTHADAGEVERLRDQLLELAKTIHKRHYAKSAPDFEPFDFSSGLIGQIDNMVAGMLQDLSTLRAQLAERDALLADAANLAMFTLPEDWHTRYAALSASAEPSATKCEDCSGTGSPGGRMHANGIDAPEYEPYKCEKCDGFGIVGNILNAETCTDCTPSAPVERDEREAFEADKLSKGFAVDLLPGTVAIYMIPAVRFAWAGWQARAALERKS